ncbi:MAG TPA: hypothetical protein VI260_13890 [Blastocatellia bacterium]|jgi:hypothetical protein
MNLLEGAETLSIQVRLRRTTIEYGYVNVEVTPDLIGSDGKLDSEGLFRRALEWGQEPRMVWYEEEQDIGPHPVQRQRELHEKSLFKGQNGFELS